MIEIGRHLEILLLDNECVIIPGLGGFVSHAMPARYDAADAVYLPPTRTVGFNQQLVMNDSLLVQSYADARDLSYPEALRVVEAEVEQLKGAIESQGSFEMSGVGVLTKNADGALLFEPCPAGLLAPELYGLSSVSVAPLSSEACDEASQPLLPQREAPVTDEAEEEAPQPLSQQEEDGDDDDTGEEPEQEAEEEQFVRIPMAWLRNAAVAAAVIVAFFIIGSPVANSNLDTTAISASFTIPGITTGTKTTEAAPVTGTEKPAEEQQAGKQDGDTYTLILASCVPQRNADIYVGMLKAAGHSDAFTFERNGIVRVGYSHFATETDAYNYLRKMRGDKYFEEAWVFKE